MRTRIEPWQQLADRQRHPGEEAQAPVAEPLERAEAHAAGDADPHGLAHRRRDHAAQVAVVDDVLHAAATMAGTAFSMFTTSLVHWAPLKPADGDDRNGLGEERGDAAALGVGGTVAAAEVARGGGRDPHDAGLGVVRGDDREQAHARRPGEQSGRGVTPSRPFCTTTTGTPSMRAAFAAMAASASCAFVHTSTSSGGTVSASTAATRACASP